MNRKTEFKWLENAYIELWKAELLVLRADPESWFNKSCDILQIEAYPPNRDLSREFLPKVALMAYASILVNVDRLDSATQELVDILGNSGALKRQEAKARLQVEFYRIRVEQMHRRLAKLIEKFRNFDAIFQNTWTFEKSLRLPSWQCIPYEIWQPIYKQIFKPFADKRIVFGIEARSAFEALDSFVFNDIKQSPEPPNTPVFPSPLAFTFHSISELDELEMPNRYFERAVSEMEPFQTRSQNLDTEILYAFHGYHVINHYVRLLFASFKNSQDASANEKSIVERPQASTVPANMLKIAIVKAAMVFSAALRKSSFMRLNALRDREAYDTVFSTEFRESLPLESLRPILENIFQPLSDAKVIFENNSADSENKILGILLSLEAFNGWADFANFVCGNPPPKA